MARRALKYARYRGLQDGDIGRTQRQQNLLRAIVKQLLKIDNLSKLLDLLYTLQENVQTNITPGDMLYLANLLLKLDENDVVTQTLPGYAYTDQMSGASYWEIDRRISHNILDALFRGQTFKVNMDYPPN
jgi:Transcriptional regulator